MHTRLESLWKQPFISSWYGLRKQQEITLGVFLDVERAFNNTSHDSMCAALVSHGVDYTILRWIRATLEGRLAKPTHGGDSSSVAVSRCYPQGSLRSPPHGAFS